MSWADRRKHAHNLAREYLIEKYDTSPDGKMQKLINALHFGLLFGPHPVEDVREEIGNWYPGWVFGCDVLGYLIDDNMPRTLWVDLDADYTSESEPPSHSRCYECDPSEPDPDCLVCGGEGWFEEDLSSWWEVNTKEALLGADLKGYVSCPHDTWAAICFVRKFWDRPEEYAHLPEWKVQRLLATDRRREQIARRKEKVSL